MSDEAKQARCHRCGFDLTPIDTYTRLDGTTYHLRGCPETADEAGSPSPVDREALIDAAAKAIHRWDKKPVVWDALNSEDRTQYYCEAECVVDAVLALMN